MSKTLTPLVTSILINTEWLVEDISEVRETAERTRNHVTLEVFCFSLVRGSRSIKRADVSSSCALQRLLLLDQDHA